MGFALETPVTNLLRTHGRGRLNYGRACLAIANGECYARVAMAAGSRAKSRASLRRVGYRIYHQLRASGELELVLAEHGVTVTRIAEQVSALINAKKTRIVKKANGNFEIRIDEDYRAQAKAVEMWMKLIGHNQLPLFSEDTE